MQAHFAGRLMGSLVGLLVLAGCVPTPAPPTITELLDGPKFATQREAAAAKADALAEKVVQRSGLAEVVVLKTTWCGEGQNNAKVHDGYRIRCSATRSTYLAWDGAFLSQQGKILGALAEDCVRTLSGPLDPVPHSSQHFLDGPNYACDSNLSVVTSWATVGVIDSTSSDFDPHCEHSSLRCQQVETPDLIFKKLSKHKWFMRMSVQSVYYTETVNR